MKYQVMRKKIDEMVSKIGDQKLRRMFVNCFYSTLETTTEICDDGTSYVFTGDIPAMWLRDSSAQVSQYLPFCKDDADVRRLVKGLLCRQMRYIALDPYSNAFNKEANNQGHKDDVTDWDSPWIWERKYEIDSLCYPIWLSYQYYKATSGTEIFDEEYFVAVRKILKLWIVEQHHEISDYEHCRPKYPQFPTLTNGGKGTPVAYTGMTWSGYRPSDDVCDYGFLIPANMFATVALDMLKEICAAVNRHEFDAVIDKLNNDIKSGIEKFGTVEHPVYGKIYAYETDGMGHYNLMDDANVPSLLSLPYLGYCSADDKIYRNTRKFVLSKDNPYFYKGEAAEGVGSPHTPDGYIWHIAIAMRMLTSTDKTEIDKCLKLLMNTDADKEVMHESFDANNPAEFTREWFAWANSLFAKAVMTKVLA